jgi:hypothetical protein
MPKALELTDDTLAAAPLIPRAAQSRESTGATKSRKPAGKADQMPLQVRLPRQEVKAIKIAAAQSEQSISDFMLACFHAFMKSRKHE